MQDDYKILFGLLSVAIALIGIAPYIRDMLRGTVKPHGFTWLIWALTSWIVAAAQIWDHAGPGAWVMVAVAMICTIVWLLSCRYGEKNITRADRIMLGVALAAIPVWTLTGSPLLSVILLSAMDVIAFGPTVRKTWARPGEENIFMFAMAGSWQALCLLAMDNHSIITMLSPASLAFCNLVFVPYLFIRRQCLKRQSHE